MSVRSVNTKYIEVVLGKFSPFSDNRVSRIMYSKEEALQYLNELLNTADELKIAIDATFG